MRFRTGVSAFICVLLTVGVASCDRATERPTTEAARPSPSPGVTQSSGVDGPVYRAPATVLQEGSRRPELCVGAIQASLPPQCGGPPIANWDWVLVDDEESAGDVTWVDIEVVGRYDGRRFGVMDVNPSDDEYVAVRPPEPLRPARRYSLRELNRIEFYLAGLPAEKRFGFELLFSGVLENERVIELGVVISTREMRDALDQEYGKGVVRLDPALRRVRP